MNLIMPIFELADVEPALVFYRDILGFEQKFLEREEASGKVMAAELYFGDAPLLLTTAAAPDDGPVIGNGIALYLYTDEDLDAYCQALRAAGVEITEELTDQNWGDRTFGIRDPLGMKLTFASAVTQAVAAPSGRTVELADR